MCRLNNEKHRGSLTETSQRSYFTKLHSYHMHSTESPNADGSLVKLRSPQLKHRAYHTSLPNLSSCPPKSKDMKIVGRKICIHWWSSNKSSVFWDTMLRSPLKVNQHFRKRTWHVLQNVGRLSMDYMALHPRRQNASQPLAWELQILQCPNTSQHIDCMISWLDTCTWLATGTFPMNLHL
jgi:hypothetical protein